MDTDLHMHSTCSDGALTPEQLAELCNTQHIERAALTDHDTIEGVGRFCSACTEYGIKTLTGVELSVEFDTDMHILGYGFDTENVALQENLCRLKASRRERIYRYVDMLRSQGIDITADEVFLEAAGASPGRPHIAKILIQKGIVDSIDEAFEKYLHREQTRKKMLPEEAIFMITEAGGIAVLAHPKLLWYDNYEKLIAWMKEAGLGGIEAYYPLHNDAEVRFFEELAHKHGLIVTKGSDFHNKNRGVIPGHENRRSEYLNECVDYLFENYGNCY